VTTINRMESSGDDPVRSQGPNIQKVLDALSKKGVEIRDDGNVGPIAEGEPH